MAKQSKIEQKDAKNIQNFLDGRDTYLSHPTLIRILNNGYEDLDDRLTFFKEVIRISISRTAADRKNDPIGHAFATFIDTTISGHLLEQEPFADVFLASLEDKSDLTALQRFNIANDFVGTIWDFVPRDLERDPERDSRRKIPYCIRELFERNEKLLNELVDKAVREVTSLDFGITQQYEIISHLRGRMIWSRDEFGAAPKTAETIETIAMIIETKLVRAMASDYELNDGQKWQKAYELWYENVNDTGYPVEHLHPLLTKLAENVASSIENGEGEPSEKRATIIEVLACDEGNQHPSGAIKVFANAYERLLMADETLTPAARHKEVAAVVERSFWSESGYGYFTPIFVAALNADLKLTHKQRREEMTEVWRHVKKEGSEQYSLTKALITNICADSNLKKSAQIDCLNGLCRQAEESGSAADANGSIANFFIKAKEKLRKDPAMFRLPGRQLADLLKDVGRI